MRHVAMMLATLSIVLLRVVDSQHHQHHDRREENIKCISAAARPGTVWRQLFAVPRVVRHLESAALKEFELWVHVYVIFILRIKTDLTLLPFHAVTSDAEDSIT
ncbi:uncharacterized protein B0H18DRAFT_988918 [Fomitopsis serialis]|uniref:uncharacterized protein n=1 Tax=Fomitopsis serialis TaxID=139415 RepID=UPI0020076CF1|nr:uncharacterized protein B0H18DRAFT_988918 [Neoantrodia serialis]KAH9931964.1 hypothetical protein B0H18DRAFT_988918 [Neoantrodia serialis]